MIISEAIDIFMSFNDELKAFDIHEARAIILISLIFRYLMVIKCAIYLLNLINVILNFKIIEREKKNSLLTIIDHCIDEKLHKEILRKSKNPNEKTDFSIYVDKSDRKFFCENNIYSPNTSSSEIFSKYHYKSSSRDDDE